MAKRPSLEIRGQGELACATVPYRWDGELRASAVAKATCTVVPNGPLELAASEPLRTAERYVRDDPALGVARPGELAPCKERADIVVRGETHPTSSVPAAWRTVRLLVGRGATVLLNKSLLACGPPARDGEPAVFGALGLGYHVALGGRDAPDNPIGLDPALGEHPRLFAIGPGAPSFGAVAESWPSRRGLLSAPERAALDGPIAELYAGFPLGFFQCAPADQQLDALAGDEWIALAGMHPSRPELRFTLPGWRVTAELATAATSDPIVMRLDTVLVDVPRLRAALLWRGSCAFGDEEQLGRAVVHVALEPTSRYRSERPLG